MSSQAAQCIVPPHSLLSLSLCVCVCECVCVCACGCALLHVSLSVYFLQACLPLLCICILLKCLTPRLGKIRVFKSLLTCMGFDPMHFPTRQRSPGTERPCFRLSISNSFPAYGLRHKTCLVPALVISVHKGVGLQTQQGIGVITGDPTTLLTLGKVISSAV
jgi:hypothetical protein